MIAHDPRFFSREFADLAGKVASENGCDAFVFDGPRSVPELSFAVRYLRANAGVVITASHNPPHDNGYKVYFNDGAQVIEPYASGIIATSERDRLRSVRAVAKDRQGKITLIGKDIDDAYMHRLDTLVLDPSVVHEAKSLQIIYTPLHGTGGVIIKPMLKRLGFQFQSSARTRPFRWTISNGEIAESGKCRSITMAIDLAEKEDADVVIATDPDCDRMGAAVRASERKNEIAYRESNRVVDCLVPSENAIREKHAE